MSNLLITREQILAELDSVPMLSHSASRILDISNDPDHTVADVSRVAETDPVITAHILKVVNSAAFSLSQRVESLERAISYLGKNTIVGIALSQSLAALYDKPLKGYESKEGELWAHSLRTALASREIAKYSRGKLYANVAYTAGLLHDIGKSVISKFMDGAAREIISSVDNGEAEDFLSAEHELLGIDHCEIGAEMAKRWGLPDSLREAIHHHHRPQLADEAHRPLVYAVHLGDMIAMMCGLGTGADCMNYQLDAAYPEYVDISEENIPELWFTVEQEFVKTKSVLFGDKEGE
jgi:putative nucleotidyltransferase with HDIG domain